MAVTTASKRAGAVLDLLMQRSKLSARKLADLARVSHTTIYARVKGEDWTYNDKARFAGIFGIPEELFDGTVSDAARWLLEQNRFEDVIDLRETSDLGNPGFPWNADTSPLDLALVG